jgi:hypothetical protein
MKLVMQRTSGDCGLSAIATLLEQSYEDVYVAAAAVDRDARGRNGIRLRVLQDIGKKLGVSFLLKRAFADEDEGVLVVNWVKPHGHPFDGHLVALSYGVVADSADGLILPVEEYLSRSKATAGSFLELR